MMSSLVFRGSGRHSTSKGPLWVADPSRNSLTSARARVQGSGPSSSIGSQEPLPLEPSFEALKKISPTTSIQTPLSRRQQTTTHRLSNHCTALPIGSWSQSRLPFASKKAIRGGTTITGSDETVWHPETSSEFTGTSTPRRVDLQAEPTEAHDYMSSLPRTYGPGFASASARNPRC